MIRNSTKLTAIAAVALLGGATALNCSKGTSSSANGDLKLAFTMPDGLTINQVDYVVHSSSNATLLSGSINTTDKNATVSLDFALQPSTNDTISLSATTTSGVSCTGTGGPFSITPSMPTIVTMTLICGTGSPASPPGVVQVSAQIVEGDHCPNLTSASAAPAQTSVGSTIAVAAVGVDPDAADTVTYAWAPAANFAAANSATTSYTCTVAGTQTITLTISDNRQPTACATTIQMPVNCVGGPVCGNGAVETGEQCDPPNGTTCSATCQTIAGSGGSTGAAGASATGGATGAAGASATGGTTGAAGASATGGTTGAAGASATGGTTGAAGASATGGMTGAAGAQGNLGDSTACNTCVFNGNANGICGIISTTNGGNSPADTACDGLTGADKQTCLDLLFCLQGKACQAAIQAYPRTADFDESKIGFDNPLPCLCGSLDRNTCIGSNTAAWNGVCAQFFRNGSAGGDVTGNYTNNDVPEGLAVDSFTCQIDASCGTACGIGTGP